MPTSVAQPDGDLVSPGLRSHPCRQCGAPVEPEDKFCQSCGAAQQSDAPPQTATAANAPLPTRHLRCKNCGAEIAVDPDQRSYVCPFCDSTYVQDFAVGEKDRQPPEFVIGFAITPEQALERFRNWLGERSMFRPGDLGQSQVTDKLKGVYLPFWSFSMLARSRWSAAIGEAWYRTESYTETVDGKTVSRTRQVREVEWWQLDGGHHNYYSGYLVSASRGLPQAEANRVEPFELAGLKRYEPYFLAGWLAEEYSIDRDTALATSQQEFLNREQQAIAAFLPGDEHSNLQVNTSFSDISSDLILLPVYLLNYRYQGKLYRFLLNGQTGRAAGDKPLSPARIGGLIVGIVLAVLLLWLVGYLLSRR